jgi:phosphoesterase RecJ-like protein
MEFLEEGNIAYTYILKSDVDGPIKNEEKEGIVEIGRDIEGVEVSVFIREIDDGFKVSLRSTSYVNVSEIAVLFGGGGHKMAAGFNSSLPIDELKTKLIEKIKKQLH